MGNWEYRSNPVAGAEMGVGASALDDGAPRWESQF